MVLQDRQHLLHYNKVNFSEQFWRRKSTLWKRGKTAHCEKNTSFSQCSKQYLLVFTVVSVLRVLKGRTISLNKVSCWCSLWVTTEQDPWWVGVLYHEGSTETEQRTIIHFVLYTNLRKCTENSHCAVDQHTFIIYNINKDMFLKAQGEKSICMFLYYFFVFIS